MQGSGFRVQGSVFRAQGSGFRVQGSGFRVQGSGFMVQGSWFRFFERECFVSCLLAVFSVNSFVYILIQQEESVGVKDLGLRVSKNGLVCAIWHVHWA